MLDNEKVELSDFIDFFPESKLPLNIADTSLLRKSPDSLRIGNKVFSQFVPDSLLRSSFGKSAKPQIYPIGKSVVKDGESYLFVKAVQGNRRVALVLVFQDNKFLAGMPLVQLNGSTVTRERSLANMDSRYTLTTLRQRTEDNGETIYTKKVYVYNTEGLFTMILQESNDQDVAEINFINPIDTLAATHKLAGDYKQDKYNLVSFRNGKHDNTLLFFAHFEKDGGECSGEIKGEAKITGTNTARFIENSGPCMIDFTFSGNTVRMKELEGCGSYRDIKCFFEGSYTRKPKPAPARSRKKK